MKKLEEEAWSYHVLWSMKATFSQRKQIAAICHGLTRWFIFEALFALIQKKENCWWLPLLLKTYQSPLGQSLKSYDPYKPSILSKIGKSMEIRINQKGIVYSISSSFTILSSLIFYISCQNAFAMQTLGISLFYFLFTNDTRMINEKIALVF